MSTDCDRTRELAPELALGILDGEERAEALEHLSRCGECRRYLEELSTTADELVLLGPGAEPPPGFESRVLERLRPTEGRWRRRWRVPQWRVAVVAAALAAATAAAVWVATGTDRQVADRYRDTLEVADGRYFTAVPLETTSGSRVGTVFGYAGEPSWCMVVVRPYDAAALRSGPYEIELVRTDGRRVAMGPLAVEEGSGSAGRSLDFEYRELSEVRLLHRGQNDVAGAVLRSAD